jgi:hypothetical protein
MKVIINLSDKRIMIFTIELNIKRSPNPKDNNFRVFLNQRVALGAGAKRTLQSTF